MERAIQPPAAIPAMNAVARQARLERLRLRHLRLLDSVAHTGSLSAAALQVGVSQPAATHMLREIEDAFGVPLIVRSASGSVLSPAGDIALQRLRVALAAVRDALADVADSPTVPTVRLGIIPAIGVTAIPHLVRHLAARRAPPRLRIEEATVPRLVDRLLRGEIDALIGRLELDGEQAGLADQLVLRSLWTDQLEVACSPGHPLHEQGRPIDLPALARADWIVAPHSARTRQFFDQRFYNAGLLPPEPVIESFSFHTNLPVVGGSQLLTVAPGSAVRHYERLGIVRALPLTEPFGQSTAVFARRREAHLPVLDEIASALEELV